MASKTDASAGPSSATRHLNGIRKSACPAIDPIHRDTTHSALEDKPGRQLLWPQCGPECREKPRCSGELLGHGRWQGRAIHDHGRNAPTTNVAEGAGGPKIDEGLAAGFPAARLMPQRNSLRRAYQLNRWRQSRER